MQLVRYRDPVTGAAAAGVTAGSGITPVSGVRRIADVARLPLQEIRDLFESAESANAVVPADGVALLAPVDAAMEVWAAGVTYLWSRDARVEESGGFGDVYTRVYDAERPELFFKSTAWRVAGAGEAIAIRADSAVDVPEPELAVVVNRFGEIFGYTICDDVSSRTIEGENPLYLPQAKVYLGGCAIGPAIRPAWEIADPYDLAIAMQITRDGETVWDGTASTKQLKRRLDELVEFLFRADEFPHGVVLSTGTCLVPELPFTLQPADVVRIEIEQLGVLENTVVRGKDAVGSHTRAAVLDSPEGALE